MREFFLLLGAVSAGQTPFQDLYGATCPPLHQCPQICKGPGSVSRQESNSQIPECPPGVGMIWDECKCCRKCASQKGQICDIMNPCDYTKGISCQEINKKGEGICLPKPGGKTCFVNGHEYGNGEEFQPSHNSCTYTGICVNGDIGVFPTCARKPPSNCEKPKLCKAQKGKCCGEWACDGKGCKNGYQDNLPFLPAHRPTEIQTIRRDDNCYVQTTAWSPCSRDCGWGIRERISNDNPECEMHKETKLCQVRPCDYDDELNSLLESKRFKYKLCARTVKPQIPVKFTFSGCESRTKHRPRYCGKCKDKKCCVPDETETIEVEFICEKDGQTFTKQMDSIKSCKCNNQCFSSSIDIFSSVKLLKDDFHRGK